MGNTCREVTQFRETDGAGPLQDYLSQLAARLKIWLIGGTIPLEANDPDKVRAACLVYDESGQRVGRYDKIHLFDVRLEENGEQYEESATIEPGDGVVVVDSPFGRIGLAVCYDLRFPELFRQLVDRGVEIIALPAAFTAVTGKAHWKTLVRARAIENLVYIIAAAQGGFHINGRETHGHSMIVSPWGNVLDQRKRSAGEVVCKIDPRLIRSTRKNFPCLDHRRLG
jgi:nitrilase